MHLCTLTGHGLFMPIMFSIPKSVKCNIASCAELQMLCMVNYIAILYGVTLNIDGVYTGTLSPPGLFLCLMICTNKLARSKFNHNRYLVGVLIIRSGSFSCLY